MTTKTDDKTNGCTFQWKIKNISHCWLKNGEKIRSPTFTANALESTKWYLELFPMGQETGDDADIELYVQREKDCIGPNDIEVNYQAVFLDKDGNFLVEIPELNRNFEKDTCEICAWERREKCFISERAAFLPKDTLTVQCTLWKTGERLEKSNFFSARTVFGVNRRSFVWKIGEFSSLKPGFRNKFKDNLLGFHLVLNEGLDFEKELIVDGVSLDKSIKYFSFKTSIIDSEGKKEYCGKQEYFADDLKRGVLSTLFIVQKLMENKCRYLPNDVLTLECECLYSTGIVSYEHFGCGLIYPKVITNVAAEMENEHYVEKENPHLLPVLVNDMKSMYNDRFFADTELRTSTQTFPAHKFILIARSPVFRRMFSNDMKENRNGHVDITDLEDDTVHRMLLYIYTDTLEDLQMESVCNLYVAADKYEIMSLKSRCSEFVKDNLCATKVCGILALADRHLDDSLKSAVLEFILRYDKEVFGSLEWKQFMDTNLKLAADVMYRKVFPG